MNSNTNKTNSRKHIGIFAAVALAILAIGVVQLKTTNLAFAKDTQMTFQSPSDAGAALAQAVQSGDELAVAEILGLDTKAPSDDRRKRSGLCRLEGFRREVQEDESLGRYDRWQPCALHRR